MRQAFPLLITWLFAANAFAATWPPAKFNYSVPFKSGGGSASIAETQAKYFDGVKLKYNAANSGATAWAEMKEQPKDGSVITLVNLPHIYIQPYVPDLHANYTPDDIEIAYIHPYTPLVLLVPIDSPIRDWYDFVEACKTSHVTVSGAGMGTVFEVGSNRLKKLAKIEFEYGSSGTGAETAINAAIAGNFTAAWTTTPVVIGRPTPDVRVLAIAAEFEFPQIDAPTFKNLGINYVDGIYRGVGLPKGTPPDVMKAVSDAFAKLNRNLTFIADVQASGATQVFMQYGSKALDEFTSRYYKQIMTSMFPPDPISRGAIYAMIALAAAGLILTIAAGIFATWFRDTPIIKGSSYFFNLIILGGILLVYTSVIVYSLQMPLSFVTPKSLSMVCRSLPWLLGLGFDITFAAIIIKCYRLYRLFLFSASSVIQFQASNFAILRWVFAICGVNALVYIVWTAYDPMNASLLSLDGDDTFYYACESNHTSAFLGVVLFLKFMMLLACIFFSIKLRDLNAMLNESKAIAAATFSTTFLLTICIAVYSLVDNFQGKFIILTGCVVIGTTCCLAALFGPKAMVVVFAPDTNTFDYVRRIMKGSDLSRGASSGGEKHRSGSFGHASGQRGSLDLLNASMVVAANAANGMHPIYIQDGRPIDRAHRDRINALTRVIVNTASSGMIQEFQTHVTKLSNYAGRFRVLVKQPSRVLSNPTLSTKNNDIPEEEDV